LRDSRVGQAPRHKPLGTAEGDHRAEHLVNDYDPPLIRVLITNLAGGLYRVTTPDSGATIVDRTRNPLQAAAAALSVLGWGPRVLLQFTLPLSAVRTYDRGEISQMA
jgi:hypothetical protein